MGRRPALLGISRDGSKTTARLHPHRPPTRGPSTRRRWRSAFAQDDSVEKGGRFGDGTGGESHLAEAYGGEQGASSQEPAAAFLQPQEVFHQLHPIVGQHALWVELHAFDREFLVAEAHDHARAVPFHGVGADFEVGGQALLIDDQRVVAGGGHGRADTAEDGFAVVLDAAGLAVHQVLGAYDFSAKRFAHGLMSQADAQDWKLAGEVANQVDADAGFVRGAGSGGDHDVVGLQRVDFVNRDLVVAADLDLRTQFAQILHKVVGERVVVVEDEDHVSCLDSSI